MRSPQSCAIICLSFTSEIAAAVFPSGFCDRGALPSNDIRSSLLAGAFFLEGDTTKKALSGHVEEGYIFPPRCLLKAL